MPALENPEQFRAELKKLPGLSVVHCETPEINEELFEFLHRELLKKFPQLEVIRLNGSEADPAHVHAELSTIPMFSSGRLVWIRHADNVLKKITSSKEILKNMDRDLADLPPETFAMFQLEGKTVPAALTSLKKAVSFQEPRVFEKDLLKILRERIALTGFHCTDKVPEAIAEKSAWDHRQAIHALDRLLLYCLNEKRITEADVAEVLQDLEGDLHFSIMDALAGRNITRALRLLQQQRMNDGLMMHGSWVKMFSDCQRFLFYQKAGKSPAEVMAELGLASTQYRMKKETERFQTMTRVYGADGLKTALNRLVTLDIRLKENTQSAAQKAVLEAFLLSLSLSPADAAR